MSFFCTGLDVRSWQFFSQWFATTEFHSWKTSMESHMFKVANDQKIPKKCCIENAFSLGASLSWSFHYFSLSTDCTFSRVLSLRTESWSVPQHVRHFPPHSWWAKSGRDAGKQWCRILNRATHNFGCICTSKWHEFIEDPEDVLVRKGWKLRGNTWTHFAMSVVFCRMSHWMCPASLFSKAQLFQIQSFFTCILLWYCWWKKSCTTWDV